MANDFFFPPAFVISNYVVKNSCNWCLECDSLKPRNRWLQCCVKHFTSEQVTETCPPWDHLMKNSETTCVVALETWGRDFYIKSSFLIHFIFTNSPFGRLFLCWSLWSFSTFYRKHHLCTLHSTPDSVIRELLHKLKTTNLTTETWITWKFLNAGTTWKLSLLWMCQIRYPNI